MEKNLFDVHKLNEGGLIKAAMIRDHFQNLLDQLEAIAGADGRDMAIVRTKLQEANFFAKRAMAVRKENQEND